MSKGSKFCSDVLERADPVTGAIVRQLTDHPSIHHHPFYYLPAWDDAMQRLTLVSHRTGIPQIYSRLESDGSLVQLTDQDDLNEWSVHPSHDGRYVYYTAGYGGWRVDVETQQEEQLVEFGTKDIREKGMVGAAMGTTTLSRDDVYWAVPVKIGDRTQFLVVDTDSLASEVILERDTIGHPQFHPDDNTWLRYAGPYDSRIWVVRRDGRENRLAYQRDAENKEWIVHETWRPGTMEILTTNWGRGVIGIDVETGATRTVCTFNAWHPMVDRSGAWMIADTKNPDTGLQLFSVTDGVGEPNQICLSEATNAGDHWNLGYCPYDEGPVDVYAPQHTHPHPQFSPDGKRVVFTSDRTGHAQLYDVRVPEKFKINHSS